MLLEIASSSKLPARGWLTDSAVAAHTLHFFGQPAGRHWEHFGLAQEKRLFLSSAVPHCPPWQAIPHLRPSLSLDGKAGDGAQYLTGPWPLSCFLTRGPGLSCFAFISICSPISPAIHNVLTHYVGSLKDMKLACFPTVWEYFYSLFLLVTEIIYC